MPSSTQITEADANSEINLKLPLPDADPQTVTLRSKNASLVPAPEANVAATLLPAMKAGTNLVLDEPLDTTFTENLSTIQNIYSTWYDEPERIDVRAPVADSQSTSISNHTATFFSGGVDSFYTLLKHEDEIDALVFVHGFDVALDDSLRGQVSEMIRRVGSHFGKDMIEVETNLRDFSGDHASWERYHGAALATVALTLQQSIENIFVPSSRSYDTIIKSALKPWGSSPLLDPLWSTRKIGFCHDGCEANRVEKCEHLSENGMALETLRVCWENRGGAYNCGRCEKCVRTMVQLLAAGALDRCTTFAEPLDPSRIKEFPAVRKKSYRYLPPLRRLEEDDRAPEVRDAIHESLQKPSLAERTMKAVSAWYRSVRHRVGNLLRTMGLLA